MKKQLLTALLATTTTLSFANDVKDTKVKLLLDWFVNPDHAAIIVAQQQGFFKKHNLDVEIIEPADPSMPPKLVASEQADLAVDYQPQLQMSVSNGLPLMRIASLISSPLNSLVVLDNGKVNNLADLKGKKIGYSVVGVETSILKAMLNTANINSKDVELINVNFSLSPSLLTQKVDAVIGAYRNFELNQLDIEGAKAKAFFPEKYGVPNYDELVVVAHNKHVNKDKFKRFVVALNDATHYILTNPEKSWQDFMSYKPKELDTELNRRAWKDTLQYLSRNPSKLNVQQYTDFAKFLQQHKLIKNIPAVKKYAVELDVK